jgi:phasin family protein
MPGNLLKNWRISLWNGRCCIAQIFLDVDRPKGDIPEMLQCNMERLRHPLVRFATWRPEMTEKSTASAKAKPAVTPAEQIYAAFVENAELILKASTDAARKTFETAVSAGREPAAAAMKTGGVAIKDYDDAVAFGRDNIETVAEVGTIAVRGMQDVGKEWVGLVQKSADELPVAVKAIAGCKTVKEAAELQADFAKTNMETFVNTAVKFQQLGFQIATATFEPINKRFTEAVSKYGKFAA